jgi:15-cis-phytoene synthase
VSGRDTNFYYSFFVLPPIKRQAIIAVWDFCRAVDDAVDEAGLNLNVPGSLNHAACRLADWRRELDRCYGRDLPQTVQGNRLKPFIQRFHLPRRAFEDVIDGVAMDLGQQHYETFEALYQYCLRVASAVGLICVEIFGYRDGGTREYAIQLGVALQLTNIIRDVAVDLANGRLYLPLEDLARFDCSEADLRRGAVTAQVRALLQFECARARAYYGEASRVLPPVDARRLVAARIMGAIYYEILRSIERADYDVFSRVIRVPRPRRAVIAVSTWARALVLG